MSGLGAEAAIVVAASAVSGLVAGPIGRRLPPRTAVVLLVWASLISAAASCFVVAVLGFGWLAQLPAAERIGRWSGAVLARLDPVPAGAGAVACLLVAAVMARTTSWVIRSVRQLWQAETVCRRLNPIAAGGLVVISDESPRAYTLAAVRSRVIVSTAMLTALPAAERRALLAHEHAHARHRHHLYALAATLAAAANPLLRPVIPVVTAGIERWADEDAATATGDRRLVASALARAALTRPGPPAEATALTAVDAAILARAQALHAPAPRPRPVLTAAVAALTVLAATGAFVTERQTEHRFERAHSAYRLASRPGPRPLALPCPVTPPHRHPASPGPGPAGPGPTTLRW